MQIYKISQESVKKHSDYKFPFHFILGFSIVLEAAIKQTGLKKKKRHVKENNIKGETEKMQGKTIYFFFKMTWSADFAQASDKSKSRLVATEGKQCQANL